MRCVCAFGSGKWSRSFPEHQRFNDMAREIEADDRPEALERAFEAVLERRDVKRPK